MFRARAMSPTLVSTLSQSFPFVASSRVKSISPGFHQSAHRRMGPSHTWRSLPARTRA
jgi:hypothetical protein